ncbi:YcjF family protein [Gemmobacter fulva]|uniref:YcjF family protein n=1 Tax=Gemmobacter fulvus TaxID=2840474 RepID=UPI0021B0A5FC|nr:YcjF family protein [Gemmobacter fulvus]
MTDDLPPLRRPVLIDLDSAAAADPGLAPPVPEASPEGRAMLAAAQITRRRASPLLKAVLWAFGALFSFVLSVAAYDFVAQLMARNPMLGSIALGLTVVFVALALALALREWGAYLRLARLDSLRERALAARGAQDLAAARSVSDGVVALYRHRPELAEAVARIAARKGDLFDADGMLDLTEQALLQPLDDRVRREIEGAARQVATVTALVPMALADVAAALFANLRMIRRIAEIYGGRSGGFASWGLLRRVFTYLVATGAVALTDDLIGSVAGGGLLSKVSRRFGEGVVNGALTARVGLAAMELCRPLPFHAAARPKVTNLMGRALAGLFDRDTFRSGGEGVGKS